MSYQVNDVIDYKIKATRGRPAMGKIIKDLGIAFLVEDYAMKQTRVPKVKILRKHESKYRFIKRKQAGPAN